MGAALGHTLADFYMSNVGNIIPYTNNLKDKFLYFYIILYYMTIYMSVSNKTIYIRKY